MRSDEQLADIWIDEASGSCPVRQTEDDGYRNVATMHSVKLYGGLSAERSAGSGTFRGHFQREVERSAESPEGPAESPAGNMKFLRKVPRKFSSFRRTFDFPRELSAELSTPSGNNVLKFPQNITDFPRNVPLSAKVENVLIGLYICQGYCLSTYHRESLLADPPSTAVWKEVPTTP